MVIDNRNGANKDSIEIGSIDRLNTIDGLNKGSTAPGETRGFIISDIINANFC